MTSSFLCSFCSPKEKFRQEIGASKLQYKTKKEVLMHRWRYPSLTIHGICYESNTYTEFLISINELVTENIEKNN